MKVVFWVKSVLRPSCFCLFSLNKLFTKYIVLCAHLNNRILREHHNNVVNFYWILVLGVNTQRKKCTGRQMIFLPISTHTQTNLNFWQSSILQLFHKSIHVSHMYITSGLALQESHGGHALRCPEVLALAPLQKFPIDFKIFQWKCPLQNENGFALSKMKFQACHLFGALPISANCKVFRCKVFRL